MRHGADPPPPGRDRAEVFFDYTCGYSNRARHWLNALNALEGLQASWRPFSLLEVHRTDDGPPVFERSEHADNVSLIALAVHEAVAAAGGDLDAYRNRMFDAWHHEPGRLSTADIVSFGQAAGLDEFEHDKAFAALAEDHAAAVELGVFGTPTLVYPDAGAAFVKLYATPAPERATGLWATTRTLADSTEELAEWHRVSPAGDRR